MTFLNDTSFTFLQYIFTRFLVQVNSKTKIVCEVGQQRLKLSAVNMRPIRLTECIFILEFVKDRKNDDVYVPIMVEYHVSTKDDKDPAMKRMVNLFKMAYKIDLDTSMNLTDVYSQMARMKGKYVNAVVKHKSYNVYVNGKKVYDDSEITRRVFGYHEPKTTRVAYLSRIRCEDKPFLSREINFHNLIDPPVDQK
jgi:hypothetical protein